MTEINRLIYLSTLSEKYTTVKITEHFLSLFHILIKIQWRRHT